MATMSAVTESTMKEFRQQLEKTFLYLAAGDALQWDWFATAVSDMRPRNHWEALARESFREDLNWQQLALTTRIPGELRSQSEPDYSMFSVALRELLDLAQSAFHGGLQESVEQTGGTGPTSLPRG